MTITHRKAQISDLKSIVSLLADDEQGRLREQPGNIGEQYIDAFHKIDSDKNQYLMVLCRDKEIIGTCHCTLMPSLTFTGSMRMQIEAVRVHSSLRGQNIGKKMIELALDWGKAHGAKIMQLSTHKERPDALRFYEQLGFKASHEGMKLYLD